ncbi:hypothetical protein CAPTEDRAFT_191103 [Capitella teleta]|uniref:F5/8 type C domain-containing protein n=1 Tax=Capitella teleta TaxID=283909 RepID=R7UWB4_CAPTE|nr:hypothetical protein CAPTEDRAFT_191103 [Capitella teleta]|eukprot:ELU10609.1 hypothetical protein CAPTEDRAFT_191103 [Capitella teleta]
MVASKRIQILLCIIFLKRVLSEYDAPCPCSGFEPLVIDVQNSQISVSSWRGNHYKQNIKWTAACAEDARNEWMQEVNTPDIDLANFTFDPLSLFEVLRGWYGNGQAPWVEVDLLGDKLIGGVVTWPRGDGYKTHQYVKTFNIQYRAGGEAGFEYYMESGNVVTFVGSENVQDIVLNGFPKKIIARHVRLNVITFHNEPIIRLEILGCTKRVLPYVNNEYTSPALCDTSAEKCIRIRNNRIRVQWKGMVSAFNSTNLVLSGKFLICNFRSTIVGIEKESTGCEVGYDLCKIEDANDDGKCQVWCHLKKWQTRSNFSID